jgi:hypothetical protein
MSTSNVSFKAKMRLPNTLFCPWNIFSSTWFIKFREAVQMAAAIVLPPATLTGRLPQNSFVLSLVCSPELI